MGFTSLTSIYFHINEEEIKHQESYFEGVSPDLAVAEYEAMGLHYEHTAIFQDYLEKGVIKEIVYEDKSRAFELAIDNPHLQDVLNEEGVVYVGDRRIVVEGELTKEISVETGELLSQHTTLKTDLNGDYDFQKNARRPGYETVSGNKYWITDPVQGNNYRYYAQAYFHSSYTTQLLAQTYYWIARAEQKKWGNWATRNDYNPIWGISAA